MKIEFTWACYLCQSNVTFVGQPHELTSLISKHLEGHGVLSSGGAGSSYFPTWDEMKVGEQYQIGPGLFIRKLAE